MQAIHTQRRNRGFSLIEVLVAVVIMSVGLLALASLQLQVIRSSAEAKTAAAAGSIAKDRIETVRSFTTVEPGYRNINSTTWAAVSDAGGLGGVSFEWQQTVTRFVYDKSANSGAGGFIARGNTLTDAQIIAGCAQCLTGKDFKRIQVDVRWADANGTQRIVSMEDVVDSLEPVESAKVIRTNVGSSPRQVKVRIVDPGTIGGVLPIAIGDGTSTAASNPTPVVRGNSNTVSETRFDVFTYSAVNGGTAQAESRVETTVMHCTCSTDNAPNDVNARGFRPAYWNGYRYAPPALTSYQPPAGWTGVSTESPFCDECCRDHHDPANVAGPKFDPWRTAGHSHWRRVNSTTLTEMPTGTYDEACRLIRVDGIFRVAADLRNDHFNFLRTNNSGALNDVNQNARPYAPTTGARDNYEDFVLDYLDDRVSNQNTTTNFNVASGTGWNLNGGAYDTLYSLNDPTTAINMPATAAAESSDSKWLHARGLYIDYMEPDAITAITDAKTNCPDKSTQLLRNACVLPYVPFTSINLTELADWQIGTNDPQTAADIVNFQVSNNAFYDPTNSNKPTRGNVYQGTNPSNNATNSVYGNLSESNSGLALFKLTIDQDEQANYAAPSPSKGHDSQPFQVGGGSPPVGTPFTINISGQANTTPYPAIGKYTDGTSCSTTGTPNPYLCGLAAEGNGTMLLKVSGYSKATTLSVPNGCRNNGNTNMPIISDYNVASATNTTQAVAANSINATGNGTVLDQTVIEFPAITNNDVLAITFSGPVRYCPNNYNMEANTNSPAVTLNCSGNGANAAPTWSSTYVVCPNGTPN